MCIVFEMVLANGLCTERQEETLAETAAVLAVPSDVIEEMEAVMMTKESSMSKLDPSSCGMMAPSLIVPECPY